MFKQNTLFVLGAGSSKEIGMPDGENLKNTISEKLNIGFEYFDKQSTGDRKIVAAIKKKCADAPSPDSEFNLYSDKAHLLKKLLPHVGSIDAALDCHKGDSKLELCGKLAIVSSILEAEKNTSIYMSPDKKEIDFSNLGQNWFKEITKALVTGVPKQNINDIFNNVTFINFNYDRCLEHYLYNALVTGYGLTLDEAIDVMSKLIVFRPYGKVSDLPFQNPNSTETVTYGSNLVDLLSVSGKIKTFNETIHTDFRIDKMHNLVVNAENIVFLGFAFHKQNLELLKPNSPCKARSVYATALGISVSDCEIIKKQLLNLLSNKEIAAEITIDNTIRSHEMFSEYSRGVVSTI